MSQTKTYQLYSFSQPQTSSKPNPSSTKSSSQSIWQNKWPKIPKKPIQPIHPYQPNQNDHNQDTCFKCRKYGQLYCCDNCFRSYHWECVSNKKLQDLKQLTHFQQFVCEACQNDKNCTKCGLDYSRKKMHIKDYSKHQSVLTFYKCTYCYSKIHKMCLQIPLQELNSRKCHQKGDYMQNPMYNFPHYICIKCLQQYGITQIILTYRLYSSLGLQTLYFYILLSTPSPIHKGWFTQHTLSKNLQKISSTQTLINQFLLSSQLYINAQLEKIIKVRFSRKRRWARDLLIGNTQDNHKHIENYGLEENTRMLLKWKGLDYTKLSWEDQFVVRRFPNILKLFIKYHFREKAILQVSKLSNPSKCPIHSQLHYKFLQEQVLKQLSAQPALLTISPSNECHFFSHPSTILTQPIIQLIQSSQKNPTILQHLQMIYQKLGLLRPTLIVTDDVNKWKINRIRCLIIDGSRKSVNISKKIDFFYMLKPNIYKFDCILIHYKHYQYQKEFIFANIPLFYTVIFDNLTNCQQYLSLNYVKIKTQVPRQIILFKNDDKRTRINDIANKLLQVFSPHTKKIVCHDMEFKNVQIITQKQPQIKKIVSSHYSEAISIFEQQKQILNQGQRLSFLKLILGFGLNLSSPIQMLSHLTASSQQIYPSNQSPPNISQYLNNFLSIISNPTSPSGQILSYYLFNYSSQTIFKRICQLKRLKNQVQKCKNQHGKFVAQKDFCYFTNNKMMRFPTWNIYQDYTLAALIIQHGFHQWNKICLSTIWGIYHAELQTRKVFKFDKQIGNFTIQQQIAPIKHKILPKTPISMQPQSMQAQQVPQTYGNYLINKIKNFKQFKQNQADYEKLLNIDTLQQHIAERAENILMSMK